MPTETDWFPVAPPEKGVVGRFEYFEQPDIAASREADEKKTRTIICLRSRATAVAGDDSFVPMKPHNQAEFIRRFPEAWEAFNGGKEQAVRGTPLTDIGMEEADILKFRMYGFTSIEAVAELADAALTIIGFGTRKWRDKAQAFVQARKDDLLQQAMNMAAERNAAPVAAAEPAKAKGGWPKGKPRKAKNDATVSTAA